MAVELWIVSERKAGNLVADGISGVEQRGRGCVTLPPLPAHLCSIRTGGLLALYPPEITDVEMKSAVAAKKNSQPASRHRTQDCDVDGIDYEDYGREGHLDQAENAVFRFQ